MVVGTSSHVGKTLLVTALCRILKRAGRKVTPFKAQNMSLNAYVTADGKEIAYAQALQAWAAGIPPTVEMNPILLKPQGNLTSQVILKGMAAGTYRAGEYYERWFEPGWQAVKSALAHLQQHYDWIICEGAGSPAEVNLKHRDLVNMRVALHLGSPTWLVADIDRGGALAHVVGTLQLLEPEERALIRGIVINKFRGSRELLQPGLDWLENYTGIPVVGVLPWLDWALPQEDSMGIPDRAHPQLLENRRGSSSQTDWRGSQLEIAVIRLPRIANFSDFDPLAAEPTVHLRWVHPGEVLGSPDGVILPGSKTTLADLLVLQQTGLADQLRQYSGPIVGICGGLQMLGETISDPEGVEGVAGTYPGLGFLPLTTVLAPTKVTRQIQTHSLWPGQAPILGYEIHQGSTQTNPAGCLSLFEQENLGWRDPSGRVWGTYLHGLFDNHLWRRQWLNHLRQQKGWDPLPELEGHYAQQREALLEELADQWQPHLNLSLFHPVKPSSA
ncbi:cobyric acid synthase [Thermostichus vulcanus]|uniref:Cobyric acid synthase n=1 Tax=Thermostichus vulcanus str. 'Rupite' TaxID=2813851 RepID=A0ABT0CDX4_THEVL|nr:cobyric acid synthase [Thermostichus vulcanus]MCJ2543977.1 cobyric acid synthase [Thermostichus vulcanus str. 'Rupite']